MKTVKISLVIAAAALFIMGMGSTVYAFHSGGVGGCEGCHTMHNSLGGTTIKEAGQVGDAGTYLLKGTTASDTCFECHYKTGGNPGTTGTMFTYQTGTGAPGYSTAGDFGWLTKAWGSDANGKQTHGHNIYSVEHGVSPDTRFVGGNSPGGDYPYGDGTKFGCQSCHDPHARARILSGGAEATTGEAISGSGSTGGIPTVRGGVGYAVGVYRILGSTGYAPASLSGAFSFANRAMRGNAASNGVEATLAGNRTVYGNNASEWCANCHAKMHAATAPGMVHPAGNGSMASGTITGNYNSYISSGKLTGAKATAFTSLVPFQSDNLGTNSDNLWQAQMATIKATTVGMESADKAACQSCHRSHASAFPSMTRWLAAGEDNLVTTFNTSSGVVEYSVGSGGNATKPTSQAEYQTAMNGRPASLFGAYQRLLCNKCHAKD